MEIEKDRKLLGDLDKTAGMNLLVSRLDQAMAGMGLNSAQLADKLGVTRSAVSYFRSGKRQPGRVMLCRMADALSVSVDFLLGESDESDIAALLQNPRIVQMVTMFQDLNDKDQQRVLEMVKLIWKTGIPAPSDSDSVG